MKISVSRTLRMSACGACLLAAAQVSAQEVSVTPVYTAPAYAQPLKLDTDRYAAERRAEQRAGARSGATRASDRRAPSRQELQAVMDRLTPEYNLRLKRDGERAANAWARQAAFEMGQEAANARGGTR